MLKSVLLCSKCAKFPTPVDASVPWAPLLELATLTIAMLIASWYRYVVLISQRGKNLLLAGDVIAVYSCE